MYLENIGDSPKSQNFLLYIAKPTDIQFRRCVERAEGEADILLRYSRKFSLI
jgi:hypothetical protein